MRSMVINVKCLKCGSRKHYVTSMHPRNRSFIRPAGALVEEHLSIKWAQVEHKSCVDTKNREHQPVSIGANFACTRWN